MADATVLRAGLSLRPATNEGFNMPKFVTIGYGDRKGYEQISEELRAAAHAQDEKLLAAGTLMGIAGKPVQVTNHSATGVKTREGPFMHASLPVAGFAMIDAADLAEAVELVSRTPCAVAYGVVEVWPLESSQ
jgi:hypothetical protein